MIYKSVINGNRLYQMKDWRDKYHDWQLLITFACINTSFLPLADGKPQKVLEFAFKNSSLCFFHVPRYIF